MKDSRAALMSAAEKGNDTLVKELLGKGAFVFTKYNGDETPLMAAAKNGHKAKGREQRNNGIFRCVCFMSHLCGKTKGE